MKSKKTTVFYLLLVIITLFSLFILNPLHILPSNLFPIEQKPESRPQANYDYYIIIDEKSGNTLMYVPLVVNIGDEVVSEENKRYKVVKIEQNRAFARFMENVNLENYKNK